MVLLTLLAAQVGCTISILASLGLWPDLAAGQLSIETLQRSRLFALAFQSGRVFKHALWSGLARMCLRQFGHVLFCTLRSSGSAPRQSAASWCSKAGTAFNTATLSKAYLTFVVIRVQAVKKFITGVESSRISTP